MTLLVYDTEWDVKLYYTIPYHQSKMENDTVLKLRGNIAHINSNVHNNFEGGAHIALA